MREQIYCKLVNRKPGISHRYHKVHDGSAGIRKIISWAYLLWLNFCYYVLFCHFLGEEPAAEIYESKRLLTQQSESEAHRKENQQLSVETYVERLKAYDIISFDLFDTLIFRPFSDPTDVFYLMGERLEYLDFRRVRIQAEQKARMQKKKTCGHTEVTLDEIWEQLKKETGIPKAEGMELEMETEENLCCGNPFMQEVWDRLRRMNKRLIVVSDMYLSEECLGRILEKAGYTGAEQIFVSGTRRKSKAVGNLFALVKEWCRGERAEASAQPRLIHVGDNPHSDVVMAEKYGIAVCPYPSIARNTLLYRPQDMSPMVGGAYRGIVNNHIYNGTKTYCMEYEYGYIYGGLFATGYCTYIHDYCCRNGIDRILFLSRDGDILRQAYRLLYPEETTAYVYWSRKAAAKLMADEDRHDFFRRFLYHKVNQNYTVWQVLHSMELGELIRFVPYDPKERLTDKNVEKLRHIIEENWHIVTETYARQHQAAAAYFAEMLSGCEKVLAVDIGWAGSGAMALRHLVKKVWKLSCEVIGMVAGTNTIYNAEPDCSEPFLQNGTMVSYLYAQSFNRDLLKKHDPGREYNIFWELLLSSSAPQFCGFYLNRQGEGGNQQKVKLQDGRIIWLSFGKYDENLEGISQIQKGILDFVENYMHAFSKYPYMLRISGRDAYAPMLLAASDKERYLKSIEKRFSPDMHVN